jgi:hypothetical protein
MRRLLRRWREVGFPGGTIPTIGLVRSPLGNPAALRELLKNKVH